MARISATHVTAVCVPMILLAAALAAQTIDPTGATTQTPTISKASKVRIVRLSEVKGPVQMDRANGRGFEEAIANLPVVEKSRIQTGQGAAEVEFEDNSTLRIAPGSLVEFPALERIPGGTTLSSVRLVKGMAYVSLIKTAGNEFNLLFGEQNLRLPPGGHIRLHVDEMQARLAVLDGGVHIETPSGVLDVPKKRTVLFAMTGSAQPQVSKDVASNEFDEWDRNAAAYHARTAMMNGFANSPYSYGLNDMAYYGGFADLGGCGTMWRPYFASAAWDPYASGSWAWYGGAGYTWVSPYPWGWMPYNYGSWSFCPGAGWGWMPGGDWLGLNNTAGIGGLKGPGHRPVSPGHPPVKGEPSLVPASREAALRSEFSPVGQFIFRKDSAGLGIPRDGLGRLDKLSQRTLAKGIATTPAYLESSGFSGVKGREATASPGFASIRRGSPPPRGDDGGFQGGSARSGGNTASSATTTSSPSSSPSHSGGSHH